jgi:adenylate cyclase
MAWSAFALALVCGQLEEAIALVDRALRLNSNLAIGWASSGWLRVWRGEPDVAIEHLARAMRLSPFGPMMSEAQSAAAHAHFFANRFEEAVEWATRTVRENPRIPGGVRILAASHALAGHRHHARTAVERLLKIDPLRRLSNLTDVLGPYQRPEDRARYAEGLRQAGLPED